MSKPFNLEHAKAGAPLMLDDGTKIVRFVHMPEVNFPLQRVLVVTEHGVPHFFGVNGKESYSSSSFIVMAPVKQTAWTLYDPVRCRFVGIPYASKECCEQQFDRSHYTIVEVTWEE